MITMTTLGLVLQASLVLTPLYQGEQRPECRSVRTILVVHAESELAPPGVRRTRAEALAAARDVAAWLGEGRDFDALAREYSGRGDTSRGAVLGTFCPGVLAPEMDRFLFSAETWQCSDPIETPIGFHVLQRIEREAGCLQILIKGSDAAAESRARVLLERLRGGEDFAGLAREYSQDPVSAARGGQLAVFERGPSDSLIKAATFALAVGEVGGPIRSPQGWHVIARVDPEHIDPALRQDAFCRPRAILIAYAGARGADPRLRRTTAEALELALSLVERIRAGEDMADLARQHDDDRGGRERAGDLGWVRLGSPHVPAFLDPLLRPKGREVEGPISTDAGWLLLRRERQGP